MDVRDVTKALFQWAYLLLFRIIGIITGLVAGIIAKNIPQKGMLKIKTEEQ